MRPIACARGCGACGPAKSWDAAKHEAVCPLVKLRCTNVGCGMELPRAQIGYHVAHECAHRGMRCAWCSRSFPLSQVRQHVPRCTALHVFAAWRDLVKGHKCDDCAEWSNGACVETFVSAKRLAAHRATCPFTMVPCVNAQAGCTAVVRRHYLNVHRLFE